jgi:hypothetical protein
MRSTRPAYHTVLTLTLTDSVLYVCVAGTDVKDRKGEQGRRGEQEYAAGADGVCTRVAARCVESGTSVPA